MEFTDKNDTHKKKETIKDLYFQLALETHCIGWNNVQPNRVSSKQVNLFPRVQSMCS